ncbi:MAG TPA: hypothetical protein VHA11_10750 [Bryobacteraceae bacterium]|nr:hypothetical protein [Bryobacteraceae bacterium]
MTDSYTLAESTWARGRTVLGIVALAGWAGCVAAWRLDPERFWASYLVGFIFVLTLALGSLFFVMLSHLTGSAWSVTARRMAENTMVALPAGLVLFVPVLLNLGSLYEWARPEEVAHDPLLQAKAAFLNPQFFAARAVVYFAVWSLWALKLYRNSVAQDSAPSLARARAAERWSAPGMLVLTVTVALAGFDWLMSLDPHWYSTMFGIYVYAGAALGFFAALILILLAFRRAGVLHRSVNHEHYHDLGKWLFGLTVFWAYIAFSQYMLIWYANLPEETVWFRDRLVGSWRTVAAVLVVGHFIVPFLVLISRAAKRSLAVLGAAAVWILLMHYADLYWIVMPVFSKEGVAASWMDAAALAAVGGTFGLVFWSRLRRRALAPTGDIRFERSLEFTNVF